MYQIDSSKDALRGATEMVRRPSRLQVSRRVWLLGLTSLFTDVSSEMVASVLPLYALVKLKLDPWAVGLIGGVYVGGASFVRLVGGGVADSTGSYKAVAVTGYTLSVASRIGLVVFGGSWTNLLWVVAIDRLGKGLRSDARDALISFSATPERLATAFGVHRALDTAGAMLGPLVAFGLLWAAPDAYDAVFVVSACTAVVGLAILVLFVEDVGADAPAAGRRERPTRRLVMQTLQLAGIRPLLAAGVLLNVAIISDAFFFLTLQRRFALSSSSFPLLYVATSAVYMVLALPAGLLADRAGRLRVFLGSHAVLLMAYAALLLPSRGRVEIAGFVVLFGAYYAGTDGVLMALVGSRLPSALRGTGMASMTTLTGLARFGASLLFGWLWTWGGLNRAVGITAASFLVAVVLSTFLLQSRQTRTSFS